MKRTQQLVLLLGAVKPGHLGIMRCHHNGCYCLTCRSIDAGCPQTKYDSN